MKKNLLIILLAGLMTLSFTACGKNEVQSSDPQVAEETGAYTSDQTADMKEEADEEIEITEAQDFAALLAPFYGTYRFDGNDNQAKDPNEIVIDENGVSYGGESLSILRVTMDNYVKFNDSHSDVMFIMNSDSVSANFLHPQDQSVLEVYPVVKRPAGKTEDSQSSAEAASPDAAAFAKMAGTYTGQYGTLTIKDDGSFTYTEDSSRLKTTIPGKLPGELTQGMTVQAGEYTLQINFRDDYSAFMLDVKDAEGTSVGGDDLSRSDGNEASSAGKSKFYQFENYGTLEQLPVSKYYTPESGDYRISHNGSTDKRYLGILWEANVDYYDANGATTKSVRIICISTEELNSYPAGESSYQDSIILGTEGAYTVLQMEQEPVDSKETHVFYFVDNTELWKINYKLTTLTYQAIWDQYYDNWVSYFSVPEVTFSADTVELLEAFYPGVIR